MGKPGQNGRGRGRGGQRGGFRRGQVRPGDGWSTEATRARSPPRRIVSRSPSPPPLPNQTSEEREARMRVSSRTAQAAPMNDTPVHPTSSQVARPVGVQEQGQTRTRSPLRSTNPFQNRFPKTMMIRCPRLLRPPKSRLNRSKKFWRRSNYLNLFGFQLVKLFPL